MTETSPPNHALARTISSCRCCEAQELIEILDLGSLPLADRLVRPEDAHLEEPRFPLRLMLCSRCSLLQLAETVDRQLLFCSDYPYYSSVSDALTAHTRANVHELVQARGLGSTGRVVEIASNDGYLLRFYKELGIPTLGIDPASGPAGAAKRQGIETLETFFSLELARKLRQEGWEADVLHANNVLAHVEDTNDLVAGVAEILSPGGVAVIEVPYVRDLLEQCQFDTIYHQHMCYFSVTALDHLFRRNGLFLNEVRPVSIHGGSLRLFVEKKKRPQEMYRKLLAREQAEGIADHATYENFGERVQRLRSSLLSLLNGLKAQGHHIAGYGAAGKGCTMLNYCGIDHSHLDYIVDRNPHKHGLLMTGVKLPILPVEHLLEDQPDFLFVLPWNFSDEIMHQQQEFGRRGGRFIIPVPEPRVV